ncbi:MAG: LAGLIDADG family homing endonuclease [Candidatus Hermodarchaeota archaeon]
MDKSQTSNSISAQMTFLLKRYKYDKGISLNSKSKNFHPNINEFYFQNIDNKEKAYWLGFLFADGYLDKVSETVLRLGIEIHQKDEILIDRFCKILRIDSKFKSYRERIRFGKSFKTVTIRFANKIIINDLLKHRLKRNKSKLISFPNFEIKETKLAFLLGFFDGDGSPNPPRIHSGSKKFLERVKLEFDLKNQIFEKQGKGISYYMNLGKDLYLDMLKNYEFSLPRKRIESLYISHKEKIEHIKANAWHGGNKRKLMISEVNLKKLVWQMPLYKIGQKLNVSGNTIKKYCIKWGVNLPSRGYWIKKNNK